MAKLSNLSRIAALALLVGTAAAAQDPWSMGFKMAGGPTLGDINTFSGNAGYAWGGDLEFGYQINKKSQLAFTLGYRFFPGDFQQLSLAPSTLPTRAATGDYLLETRIRKAEVGGFQIGAVYRSDLPWDAYYWQAGLRIGFNKATETDTGSTFTQTVTTANSAGTITKVAVINSQLQKTVVSPGLTAGMGYRFTDTYSLELNWSMVRTESPSTKVSQTGSAFELAFGIRF